MILRLSEWCYLFSQEGEFECLCAAESLGRKLRASRPRKLGYTPVLVEEVWDGALEAEPDAGLR